MRALLLGLGLIVSTSALARVTPAHLAFEQVRHYVEGNLVEIARDALPPIMQKSYPVGTESHFFRGKFSVDGFADFMGSATFHFQMGGGAERYNTVTCHSHATAQVVSFAMQTVPILEEVTGEEQLILRRHGVSCRLVD